MRQICVSKRKEQENFRLETTASVAFKYLFDKGLRVLYKVHREFYQLKKNFHNWCPGPLIKSDPSWSYLAWRTPGLNSHIACGYYIRVGTWREVLSVHLEAGPQCIGLTNPGVYYAALAVFESQKRSFSTFLDAGIKQEPWSLAVENSYQCQQPSGPVVLWRWGEWAGILFMPSQKICCLSHSVAHTKSICPESGLYPFSILYGLWPLLLLFVLRVMTSTYCWPHIWPYSVRFSRDEHLQILCPFVALSMAAWS